MNNKHVRAEDRDHWIVLWGLGSLAEVRNLSYADVVVEAAVETSEHRVIARVRRPGHWPSFYQAQRYGSAMFECRIETTATQAHDVYSQVVSAMNRDRA